MAAGYSGRANAVSALRPQTRLADDFLDWTEALYADEGLPPCIRVTPLLADGTQAQLEARGYRVRDRSIGMIATLMPLARLPGEAGLVHRPVADAAWVRGISALQSGNKKDADEALMAIVSRIRLPASFATISHAGAPVGYGMTVIERGMAELGAIILAPEARGRGLGRALVAGLMRFAWENGAGRAYLQVEQGNAPAIALYDSLGFVPVYAYATMVRD
jgi:ribosomal protein S18 acetylase RimI-like enzyme